LLSQLEGADTRGAVNLFGSGVYQGVPVDLSYKGGRWQVGLQSLTRAELQSAVASFELRATVVARLPHGQGDPLYPMPLLTVTTVGAGAGGDPNVPILGSGGSGNPMSLRGEFVRADARVLVDGAPGTATLGCVGGSFAPFCSSGVVSVSLSAIPAAGLHLLQVQNGDGPISPEVPFCVGSSIAQCL
jgi:hypothetical protein